MICSTHGRRHHSCSVHDQQPWQPLDCTHFLLNARATTGWRAASCIMPCMHGTLFAVQAQVRQMVKSERELSSELRTAQDHIDTEMQQLKQSAQVSGSKRQGSGTQRTAQDHLDADILQLKLSAQVGGVLVIRSPHPDGGMQLCTARNRSQYIWPEPWCIQKQPQHGQGCRNG